MEQFYLEKPTIERKKDGIEYIKEFIDNNDEIHGVGGLNKYIDNYEEWLKIINENWDRKKTEKLVPSHTYFLVRNNDKKIVGMIDIRLELNDFLKKYGGNIGYSIRPSERKKGYNRINLYLGLKICDEYGLENVMLDADINNIASWKTMESLGGIRTKEYYDNEISHCNMVDYNIDVKLSLKKYKKTFEPYITKKE